MEAAKERLASGYSRSALQYDALAGHMYVAGIRRLLPRVSVRPSPSILDVGCGTGVNLLEAARWFAPTGLLCGIDLAPGMVAVAQAKASAMGVPALITVGDAERLPYPDGLFDLVLCNSVLQWFDRDFSPGPLLCRREPGPPVRVRNRVLAFIIELYELSYCDSYSDIGKDFR